MKYAERRMLTLAKVTILGTGAMGSRMAEVLLKSGNSVVVWNRSPEKTAPLISAGAVYAETPAAAVGDADFVISMLRDNDASRDVWLSESNGALKAMPVNAVLIESSTITPDWAKDLSEQCRHSGIAYLDAPVVGSRPQAAAGQLIFLVGGDKSAYEKAGPLFETMGKAAYFLGPAGSGAVVKLVVNSLLGVQVTALAELIGVLRRLDIDTAKAVEVICATPVISPSASLAATSILSENFAPLFPVELIEKDMNYLLATAAQADAQTPMVEAAGNVFRKAIEAGYGGEQMTAAAKLYKQIESRIVRGVS